jgi:hypothetical protein
MNLITGWHQKPPLQALIQRSGLRTQTPASLVTIRSQLPILVT